MTDLSGKALALHCCSDYFFQMKALALSGALPHTIVKSVFYTCMLSFILLLAACSGSDKAGMSPADTAAGDSLSEEIHKIIYENPSHARIMAQQLLEDQDADNLPARIRLLKYIGSSYAFETRYTEAIKYYNQALALAEEIRLYLEIAHINNNLGMIYNETGNYKTAYLYLSEALNNYSLAKVPEKMAGTYNNIGLIYLNLKNYDKALTYFNKALDSSGVQRDSILIVSVLNNIALCYISENDPPLALGYLNKAVALSRKIGNKYGLCISYQLMGNYYLVHGRPEQALEAFKLSTAIARETNLSYQLAVARLGTAGALNRLNQSAQAFAIAREVLQMAGEQNSLVLKSEAHEVMSDICEKTGDYKNSLFHYREHKKAQQELINQAVVHQVYDVELNYLSQLNKMQQLELDKKELAISKKNNLLFFISLTFIMLLTGLYLLYLNHRHRQNVKLQKTVIELTEKKTNAVLEAEIQERKRIGSELHDSLGHLLSLAGLNASVLYSRKELSDEKKKTLLESLMKSIDDAFDEVRTISHNLAPSLLSERGLKGALKSISDRVNQSTRLNMSFDTFGLSDKLDNLIENTLFRTIQEIVNNTIKHAEAGSLFIQITQGDHEISLMAEDDGKGFNFDEIKQHSSYGLAHMKSRIENLHGTMFIDSNPGRGTIISILIPLQ